MAPKKVREVTGCAPRRYGRYRYFLEVRVSDAPARTLAVVLKNPSTASTERSDPSVGTSGGLGAQEQIRPHQVR